MTSAGWKLLFGVAGMAAIAFFGGVLGTKGPLDEVTAAWAQAIFGAASVLAVIWLAFDQRRVETRRLAQGRITRIEVALHVAARGRDLALVVQQQVGGDLKSDTFSFHCPAEDFESTVAALRAMPYEEFASGAMASMMWGLSLMIEKMGAQYGTLRDSPQAQWLIASPTAVQAMYQVRAGSRQIIEHYSRIEIEAERIVAAVQREKRAF